VFETKKDGQKSLLEIRNKQKIQKASATSQPVPKKPKIQKAPGPPKDIQRKQKAQKASAPYQKKGGRSKKDIVDTAGETSDEEGDMEIENFGIAKANNKNKSESQKKNVSLVKRRKSSILSAGAGKRGTGTSSAKKDDDSGFFLFDDNIDLLVECYSEEDDFIDIHEVQKNENDYEIIGGNYDLGMNIGQILLPKKAEIHVGEDYQCSIPNMDKDSSMDKRLILSIWDAGRISPKLFEVYMIQLSHLTEISLSNLNEEKAAEILVDHGYSVKKALEFCAYDSEHVAQKVNLKKKRLTAVEREYQWKNFLQI